MKILQITVAVVFFLTSKCFAQKNQFIIPDSLKSKNIEYLKERLSNDSDSQKLDSIYGHSILSKAKADNNPEKVIEAYKIVMYKSNKKTWLNYCDSIMSVAVKSRNNELIGSAYLTKGIVYYHFKQESKALDNYILADHFISKTHNQYLIHKTKYSIASIKYYLGFYDESISLLKECEEYFRVHEPGNPRLLSLHLLSLCYIKTKQYNLAAATIDLGYREAINLDELTIIPYFTNAEGRNEFFKKNYKNAISKLNKSLPHFIQSNDIANTSTTNLYLGRSYWELGNKEKAVPYFKKVDETFKKDKFMKEDLIEAYYLLAQYYESRGDKTEQLKYLHGLLEAETFVSKNYRYLSKNMYRHYDLKKIADETEELKGHLFFRNKMDIIFGIIFLLITTTFTYIFCKQYQRRKIRKQRFKNLVSRKIKKSQPVEVKEKIIDGEQIIKPEIISVVSKKLEKFEESNLYLDKDFNLSKMAAFVDCNTRYTSRIISETRNKKYIEYVDDLRIEFIIEKLKNDSKYRNYTIKALTEEAGFKSPQKFKEAFTKATDLTPLYFIKELKKQDSKQ